MRVLTAAQIDERLSYPALVDVMARAFTAGAHVPPRHHQVVPRAVGDATWLLMPAWTSAGPSRSGPGSYMGLKSVTVFPGNAALGKPAVQGVYVLLSGETGEAVAVMDAARLTVWRTAAASALAARYLARTDASRLLMVGSGALAPYLVRAHASVRPIQDIAIWSRNPAHAVKLSRQLKLQGFKVAPVADLAQACGEADIISTATLSSTPLVEGAWLKPGTHLDCVGAFTKLMRETDDEVARRASIYLDSWDGLLEAGDVAQPLDAGVITRASLKGDLAELVKGTVPGRTDPSQITLFKSVGTALEDLACAIHVHEAA